MIDEVKELLLAHSDWFKDKTKRVWQPEELALTYHIFNLHFGENRKDTGCGSCRRSIISNVRGLYNKLITQEKQT
jgi:hypothetical protein